MKKAISVVLALVMLFAVCVPAFAADISATGTGDVIVSTSTKTATGEDAESYTVTIPADTTIAWGTDSTDVGYTVESHLARNKAVAVAVTGSGEMKTVDGVHFGRRNCIYSGPSRCVSRGGTGSKRPDCG